MCYTIPGKILAIHYSHNSSKVGMRQQYTNLQTLCPANFQIWLSFDHNNIGHDHQENLREQIYLPCPAFTKIQ